VCRFEQPRHRAADDDHAAEHLRALDVELLELLAHECECPVVGFLGGRLIAEEADREDLASTAVKRVVRREAVHLLDAVGEVLVDGVHEVGNRPAAVPVAPHAREPPGRPDVGGREHVRRCAADNDLAMERLDPRELEIAQILLGPALGQIARGLRLIRPTEHADGEHLALAAVDELVRHESGLRGDLLGEAIVDPVGQIMHRPSGQAVAPDACKHSLLPSSGMSKRCESFSLGHGTSSLVRHPDV
jgi:hypothetical protein